MTEELSKLVPSILNYGAIGLALLLAYFSYSLLKKVIEKDQDPKTKVLASILTFTGLCVLISAGGIYLEYVKYTLQPSSPGWASLLGPLAQASFVTGGEPKKLVGKWEGKYSDQMSESEVFKPYQYRDATGKMIDYPSEIITCQVSYRSVLSCDGFIEGGTRIKYWSEGRMSVHNDIALVYWASAGAPGEEDLSGINFLHYEKLADQPAKLKGWWAGRTRKDVVEKGMTEWTKKE